MVGSYGEPEETRRRSNACIVPVPAIVRAFLAEHDAAMRRPQPARYVCISGPPCVLAWRHRAVARNARPSPERALVSPRVEALRQIEDWAAPTAAAGVVRAGEVIAVHGPHDLVLRWASVT